VKGTSTLYSKEYYELVKAHLNPGGVVAQWLPIYDSDPATVKSELATFFSVFPNGTVWSNYVQGQGGFDLVLIGRADSAPISLDVAQERLDRPDYARVLASISEIGFHSAVEFLGTYAGRAADLRPFLEGAEINDDMNLRLQYLAGLGLNSMAFEKVYLDMVAYRRFPEDVFTGTEGRMNALRALVGPPASPLDIKRTLMRKTTLCVAGAVPVRRRSDRRFVRHTGRCAGRQWRAQVEPCADHGAEPGRVDRVLHQGHGLSRRLQAADAA
jgi:hypothetical protein